MRKRFLRGLVLTLFFLTACASTAFPQGNEKSWELAIGGGTSLDGNHFRHLLAAPSMSISPPSGIIVYRIEGDLELIKADGRVTAVIGVAPFARLFMQEQKEGPFLEIGAGANLLTRRHTGEKDSGGSFAFTLMSGIGYKSSRSRIPFGISCRFRHISNGHIYPSNNGMNSLLLLFEVGLSGGDKRKI